MKYIIESKHHSSNKWNQVNCGSFKTLKQAEKELQKEDYTMFDLDTYKFRIVPKEIKVCQMCFEDSDLKKKMLK